MNEKVSAEGFEAVSAQGAGKARAFSNRACGENIFWYVHC